MAGRANARPIPRSTRFEVPWQCAEPRALSISRYLPPRPTCSVYCSVLQVAVRPRLAHCVLH